ncbi:hypothetical protein ma49 [Moumouvirus australiensis]|uniref:Uncharacterized protein n=1 Tax=Moumouvirus australiensis TaxID=2109587 RepID=A0A2P1EKL8_9VIRU|nr:hypothetical protein QKC55_gp854 [Moumouvirus australiensis]AVL94436.1 hypothetical protein ma49 [Moumouvirus australiensis]
MFTSSIILSDLIKELAFTSSLQLNPVIESDKYHGNINIDLDANIKLEKFKSLILQNLKINIHLDNTPIDFIDMISNEIYLAMNIEGEVVNYLKWNFNIVKYHGSLHMYAIKSQIINKKININYQTIKLTQEIPKVYDTVRHCARTGGRKYIFAGPRDLECHTHNIPRELNQRELTLINNNLISVANNIKLIN